MIDNQVQEIKDKLSILDVVSSYVKGIRKSGNNYFALCPFHNEKTPSFSINPDLGIYKCFGCQESGDIFTFIEKIENVEFKEALEIAAKKAGVTLRKKYNPAASKLDKEKNDIYKLNFLVAQFYNYILTKHKAGKRGQSYAEKREIPQKLIDEFNIGYAPKSYASLLNFLNKKGYNKNQLIKWGVVVSKNAYTYDKFRQRLIFPLFDRQGNIVGFSGRTILSDTKAPKYLHSPTTLVFDKSSYLFGIFQAKKAIRENDQIIFCEGQLDVISSHKTKVKNVVASLGTSITEGQFELAKKFTNNVCLCFDNDLAGEKAIIKASSMAHKAGMNVKAIYIPKGKDADEFIRNDKLGWEKAVLASTPIIEHMIKRLQDRIDLSNLQGKKEFFQIILSMLSAIPEKIEKAFYIKKVSVLLDISEEVINEELATQSPENLRLDKTYVDQIFKNFYQKKEEYLLALMFQHPDFIEDSIKKITSKIFLSQKNINLIEEVNSYHKNRKKFDLKKFLDKSEDKEYIKNLLLIKLRAYFDVKELFLIEIQNLIVMLKANKLKNRIKQLNQRLKIAASENDKKTVRLLLEKINLLSKNLP